MKFSKVENVCASDTSGYSNPDLQTSNLFPCCCLKLIQKRKCLSHWLNWRKFDSKGVGLRIRLVIYVYLLDILVTVFLSSWRKIWLTLTLHFQYLVYMWFMECSIVHLWFFMDTSCFGTLDKIPYHGIFQTLC